MIFYTIFDIQYFSLKHFLNHTISNFVGCMNCFREAVATLWMFSTSKLIPSLQNDEVSTAEESLLLCRNNLQQKRSELEKMVADIDKMIEKYRKTKDVPNIKLKIHEKKRYVSRIEKISNSILIVEKQVDALQSNLLDKAILNSLKLSSNVMKKAGVSVRISEVENVMNELDERIQESSEVSHVLGTPIHENEMFSINEDDEELKSILMDELKPEIEEPVLPVIAVPVPETTAPVAVPDTLLPTKKKVTFAVSEDF